MFKNGKKILILLTFTLTLVIASKYLIKKSDEVVPRFYVLIANTEIKAGDLITESKIEPMIIPASLVKSQSFYWSFDEANASVTSELTTTQIKKVVGKTASKLFNRGDQISVNGIK